MFYSQLCGAKCNNFSFTFLHKQLQFDHHFESWSQSYQTFFFLKRRFFPFFAIKLGYFKVQTIFSYATNTQA
jgi:hypothetical protein